MSDWLVVLDPITGLISRTDTSLAIINQARAHGITVHTATIEQLFFETHAAVIATDDSGKQQIRPLADYALILMRKEPPYDLAFHYATHLLSLSGTLVINSPSSLRDFNEKLIALPFIEYMPPTLVSSDPELIGEFLTRYGTGVIKSLDSFQGKSVQKIAPSDHAMVTAYTREGKQPVMVQKFIEDVIEDMVSAGEIEAGESFEDDVDVDVDVDGEIEVEDDEMTSVDVAEAKEDIDEGKEEPPEEEEEFKIPDIPIDVEKEED